MRMLFLIVAWSIMLLVIFAPPTKCSTYSFRCPFNGREVTAEFDEEVWGHRRVDVASCSASFSVSAESVRTVGRRDEPCKSANG